MDSHAGAIEAALHHRSDGHIVFITGFNNSVAISQAGC